MGYTSAMRIVTRLLVIAVCIAPLLQINHAKAATCLATISDGSLRRIAGLDRGLTAVEVSRELYPNNLSADAVVLTRQDLFADGLAGTSFAALNNGPILLVGAGGLGQTVTNEIQRVLSSDKTVYILGGRQALPSIVESDLQQAGYSKIVRISGPTRYQTAEQIAQRFPKNVTSVGLASGADFADGLALGAVSARDAMPLLLTQPDELPDATRDFLADRPSISKVHLAGGVSAVSADVEQAVKSLGPVVTRYAGATRYDTSVEIANAFFGSDLCSVGLATGNTFADSLAAGVLLGQRGQGLLLVQPEQVPTSVKTLLELRQANVSGGFVFGGTSAINELTQISASAMIEPATFIFWGDSGESNSAWNNVAAAIVQQKQTQDIDGMFMLGDNIYNSGASSASDPAFATLYENPFASIIGSTVINVVLGNHDVVTNNGQGELDYALTHPYWHMPSRFYAQTIEANRIVALDSNQASVDQAQLDFLSQQLAADPLALHRIVIAHHPIYSSGEHGLNNEQPWMQSQVNPVVIAGNADFFLSGHDHNFEAIVPRDGVNYIVSGGASRLRPITATSQSINAFSEYHFSKLEIFYSYADLTVYDQNNQVLWTHRYQLT
jgi:putative cell wall-binding protein